MTELAVEAGALDLAESLLSDARATGASGTIRATLR